MNISNQNIDSNNQLVQVPSYHNLLNFYKPNFVLVNQKNSLPIASIFGNIIPIYISDFEFSKFINSTKKNTLNVYILGKVGLVCLLSMLQQIINNVAYQGYLLLLITLEEVSLLPEKKRSLQKSILAFIGITDVTVHGVSGTNIPNVAPISIKKAKEEIEALTV